MRVAFIVLFILIGVVTISEISQSFAEKGEVPNWIKTTLALWSNGEITNEEFVKAIDYLTAKGIVTISSINDKEVQRQVEYLKAKSEVFQEEVKDLREENKEYRILLKSQEINKSTNTSTKNPRSMEVWVFFVLLGLVMDIVGIWMIVKPLLNRVYKNKEGWEKRKLISEHMSRHEDAKALIGIGKSATNQDFARLEKYVYERLGQEMSYKENQKSLAYAGLFIITFGFIFQMVGYYAQSLQ